MQSSRARLFLILGIVLAAVGCDQITKHLARLSLRGAGTVNVVGDVLVLRYVENPGAFLGLGSSWPPALRTLAFGVLSGLLVLAFAVYTFRRPRVSAPTAIAFALILGGGIANMIDRGFRGGQVTDFLNLGIGRLRTGIFNLADLFLMIGVVAVLLLQGRRPRPGEPS